jgi:hypothetical protein
VKKLWQTSWRLALCALLLVWVFHSIFVHEARLQRGETEFNKLPRTEQWKQGWETGPRELGSKLTKVAPACFSGWLDGGWR